MIYECFYLQIGYEANYTHDRYVSVFTVNL